MSITSSISKILPSLFAIIFTLFPTLASAQNLLVNGDFEAQPFPIGNNIYQPVTGWHAGYPRSGGTARWPLANVVGVDGSGPDTYGTPLMDATGGNTLQHYFDGYGQTYVWQFFTAPCSGTARVSMAYSTRDSATTIRPRFSLERRSGGPVTLPTPGSSVSQRTYMPAPGLAGLINEQNFTVQTVSSGNPQAPWASFQYTRQLVGGQLYTFLVDLPQDGNLDNASVEMIDGCTPPTPPLEDATLNKTCDAPVEGTHNGVVGQLWSCRIAVSTQPAPFTGTLTVNDVPAQNYNNTSGTVISMTSSELGIDCSGGPFCTVEGADFDGNGVINVETFVQTTAPATSYTAQNCVSGSYFAGSVEAGSSSSRTSSSSLNDSQPIAGNCATASFSPSTSSVKTCEPIEQVASGPMTMNCRLTSTGSNLPSGSHIALLDGFAAAPPTVANVVGTMMNVTSTENWSCLDVNTGPPSALGACSLPAADLQAAGGTSHVDVTFQFDVDNNPAAGEERPIVANCPFNDVLPASVTDLFEKSNGQRSAGKSVSGARKFQRDMARKSSQKSGDFVLPDGCVTLEVPPYKEVLPELKEARVSKVCKGPEAGEYKDAKGLVWNCSIRVDAAPAPFSGSFSFTEDASGISSSGGANLISVNHSNPAWACAPSFPNQTTTCEISGADFSSTGTETVEFELFTEHNDKPVEGKNCASGTYTPVKGEPRKFGGECVPIEWKPNDEETTFNVEKICEPRGKRHYFSPQAWVQPYACSITVTTNGVPFTTPIYVQDELTVGGAPAGQIVTGLSSTDPWTCNQPPYNNTTAAGCWIMGAQFPHSAGSSTINVDMVVNSGSAEQGIKNCATLNTINVETGKPTPIGESCTTLSEARKPALDVTKLCAKPVRNGSSWDVNCTVTISGSNLTPGHQITLSDEMSSVPGINASMGMLQSSLGQCGGNTNATGFVAGCTFSTDDLIASPNGSITFPYSGTYSASGNTLLQSSTGQNCAYADVPGLNLHAPGVGNDKACVPLDLDLEIGGTGGGTPVPADKRNLAIEKQQTGSCTAGSPCSFRFSITNTGTVAMNVPQLVDTLTPASGSIIQSASPNWDCQVAGGQMVCNPLSPITLQPNTTHQVDVLITLPKDSKGDVKNCVGLQWSPYEIAYQDRSVRSIQQALANKGYNPGPIDNAMGRLTREAIAQFQRQNGLPQTGEMNEKSAGLLFGEYKPRKLGDDISSDDRSCIGVEYKPYEEQHSRRQSVLDSHSKYKSSLETFHEKYESRQHDGKRTRLVHDRRISRIHQTYRSNQHDSRTTRVSEEHSRKESRLRDFHKKYKSGQHDGRVTKLRHDRRKSRMVEFHRKFESSQHEARTTRVIREHSRSKSALLNFHRKYKSSQHDGKVTRLRHDRRKSRMVEFHRKYKSSQHESRTTRVIREHSKSKSALRNFHRKYKSNQHDGKVTRLRHDRRKSRMVEFHRKYKSSQHEARTTRVIREHSRSKSALRNFHRKYKSSQHDGKVTRLRHDRRKSRLREIHRKFKSEQHEAKSTRIRINKPRPRPAAEPIKKQ